MLYYVVEGAKLRDSFTASDRAIKFVVTFGWWLTAGPSGSRSLWAQWAAQDKAAPQPHLVAGLHVPVSEGVAVVFGPNGAEVGSFIVSAGRIDLSDLPAGTYIVRLPEHELRVVKQ